MPTIARQIYVISDLHVGGQYPDGVDPITGDWPDRNDRGFRICTRVDALAGFVRSLADRPAGGSGPAGEANGDPEIELVINGDFVDFLAEEWDGPERWKAFIDDEDAAARRMADIIERDRVLFDALAALLHNGHRLIILLGNHDVELCFPRVRRCLEQALGVDRGSKFEFIYDGQAYVVGDAIIEHGNRYDAFNVVDHDGLRRVRSSQSRREELSESYDFRRPPGSKLVAGVMNHLKSRFPFIDLLKPEDGAAVPIVLALAPAAYSVIARLDITKDAAFFALEAKKRLVLGSAVTATWGGDISSTSTGTSAALAVGGGSDDAGGDFADDMFAGDISSVDGMSALGSGPAPETEGDDGLQALLAETLGGDSAASFTRAILDAAPEVSTMDPDADSAIELDTSGDISAFSLASRVATQVAGKVSGRVSGIVEAGNRMVNVGKLLLSADSKPLGERIDALYAAIRAVQDDRSFDRTIETRSEYRDAAERLIGNGFKVVVFGHTHLAKRVEIAGGLYLNSGTWADLMRFPRAILEKPASEARGALLAFVEALDQRRFADHVEFIPTYVRLDLSADDKVVNAELMDHTPSPEK